MTRAEGERFSREAVAVFHSAEAMQAAIDELLSSGFDRAELNLLADESAVDEKLGHVYRRVTDAEDDAAAPRTGYVAPDTYGDAEGALVGALIYVPAVVGIATVVSSGGTMAAAAAAAALGGGAGGVVGGILARLVGERHATKIHEQLSRGGLVLWVLTETEDKEAKAVDILKRHFGHDVHVHGVRLPAA